MFVFHVISVGLFFFAVHSSQYSILVPPPPFSECVLFSPQPTVPVIIFEMTVNWSTCNEQLMISLTGTIKIHFHWDNNNNVIHLALAH